MHEFFNHCGTSSISRLRAEIKSRVPVPALRFSSVNQTESRNLLLHLQKHKLSAAECLQHPSTATLKGMSPLAKSQTVSEVSSPVSLCLCRMGSRTKPPVPFFFPVVGKILLAVQTKCPMGYVTAPCGGDTVWPTVRVHSDVS